MKKCTIGLFSKIIAFAVLALFFVPMTGLMFYLAILEEQISRDERLAFFGGGLLFGAFLAFAAYRVFYLGLVWVEYDSSRVVFHYSRKEQYIFRWEEMPGSRIAVAPGNGGYIFSIRENGRKRDIPLNRMSKGYKEFEKVMETAGVQARIGVVSQEEFRKQAEQVFEQFGMYRAAHPGSVNPKPEGNCLPCPACQGKGLQAKNLPILNVSIGKVCKSCGGSGYIRQ